MSEAPAISQETMHNSQTIRSYAQLRDRIFACIDSIQAIENACEDDCSELKEKLETNTFNLVVVGQFKRGKTCLINALLGADILPVAVVPLTSIVTILTYGEFLNTQVFFSDGKVALIEPKRLAEYVTETGNPKNIKNVREVLVNFPSAYLKDGVRLIDTPGVGSVYLHNTDVAYEYLPKSDAALFLLSVEQPVSQAELDFLRDVRQYSHRIFFLLNKIDYLSETEIKESISFTSRVIEEAMGTEVRIFPVSAKLALGAKKEQSEELLLQSRLPAFSEVLDRFLMDEKGKVLLLSAAKSLMRNLAQARLESELEIKSLSIPLEELEDKLEAFEKKKQEILQEKENFDILLDSDINRLVKTAIDDQLTSFRQEFNQRMEEQFEVFYNEHKHLSLKELNDALEGFVMSEVEQGYTAWQASVEDALGKGFKGIRDHFIGKIKEIVDALLAFSCRLFAVPFEPIEADSLWTAEMSFFYRLREDPVGLEMLDSSLTQRIPGFIANRFEKLKAYLFKMADRRIYRKRKEHMLQLSDMQGGRLRYHFTERLNKGKQQFRKDMLRRIEATVDGIGAAIENGLDQRLKGERELEERQAVLYEKLAELDRVRRELQNIRESIGEL